MADYTYFANLLEQTPEMPKDGIASRTFLKNEAVKALLFHFDVGQELSEHTASVPAIIHILHGEADITLGADRHSAQAGTWVYMPANLPHSILAKTHVVMLLLMLQ